MNRKTSIFFKIFFRKFFLKIIDSQNGANKLQKLTLIE